MTDHDRMRLQDLNLLLAALEDSGDRRAFRALLASQGRSASLPPVPDAERASLDPGQEAPCLAFRRRSGLCEDASAFLASMKRSGPRQAEIESVSFFGKHRAVVTCVVTIGSERTHNLRLFVRTEAAGDWKLLGWANEPL